MSKLFKLKEWLTISGAAKHLSGVLEEEVGEADVLQMGLDGRLKISIRFVNSVQVDCGIVTPKSQAKRKPMSPNVMAAMEGMMSHSQGEPIKYKEPPLVFCGPTINDDEVFEPSDDSRWVKGVFDLMLISDDTIGLERRYQSKTDGVEVGAPFFAVTVIEGANGEKFKINISDDEWRSSDDPFPKDAVLVVRTAALRELEKSIAGNSSGLPIPLAATERHTLLKQIGALSLALAEQSKKYKRGEKPNGLQIANFAGEIIDALPGANTAGLGVSNVRESIRQGIELLTAIQQ